MAAGANYSAHNGSGHGNREVNVGNFVIVERHAANQIALSVHPAYRRKRLEKRSSYLFCNPPAYNLILTENESQMNSPVS